MVSILFFIVSNVFWKLLIKLTWSLEWLSLCLSLSLSIFLELCLETLTMLLILLLTWIASCISLYALFLEARVGKVQAKRLEGDSRNCRNCRLVYSLLSSHSSRYATFSSFVADPTDTAVTQQQCHRFLDESESHSVLSDSLRPHGLYSPWNSPGQNTGVGSLFLLQGTFPTQGLNLDILHYRQILYQLNHKRSHTTYVCAIPYTIKPVSPEAHVQCYKWSQLLHSYYLQNMM